MPVLAATAALANKVSGRWSGLLGGLSFGRRGRIVTGEVDFDWIRLQARRPGTRNSWRPVLTGHLVETPGGSQLIGHVGMGPFTKIFSAVCIGMDAVFLVIGLTGIVAELIGGDPSRTLPFLAMTGATLALAAWFMLLTAIGSKMGDSDAAFLTGWLDETLHTPQDNTGSARTLGPG
jgi:hypothetical protein